MLPKSVTFSYRVKHLLQVKSPIYLFMSSYLITKWKIYYYNISFLRTKLLSKGSIETKENRDNPEINAGNISSPIGTNETFFPISSR